MTTETQSEEIRELIKNGVLIQEKMAALTSLFEKNVALLRTLTNGHTPAPDDFSDPEKSLMTALASLAAVKVSTIPRPWLAVIARMSPKSSTYRAALASLQKRGLLEKDNRGSVKARQKLSASPDLTPLDWTEIMKRFAALSKPQESALLYQLMIHAYDNPEKAWMDRKTLAERAEQNPDSSSFRERLTQLKGYGFIDYGPESTVRASIRWFTPAGKATRKG